MSLFISQRNVRAAAEKATLAIRLINDAEQQVREARNVIADDVNLGADRTTPEGSELVKFDAEMVELHKMLIAARATIKTGTIVVMRHFVAPPSGNNRGKAAMEALHAQLAGRATA